MIKTLFSYACLILGVIVVGCSEKEEDVAPCLHARVVDIADPCSGGVLLELTAEEYTSDRGFCGTPGLYKYVTVDNLPDDLKHEGATFTCQIEKTEGKVCPAIYMNYEAATITRICSSDTILPR